MATDAPQTLENEIPQHAAAGLATGGTDQPAPRESIARSSNEISPIARAGSAFVKIFKREPASPSDTAWLNGFVAACHAPETNVSPLRCAAIVSVPHERRITLRFETDFQYAAAERYVCFTERGAPALRCPPCLEADTSAVPEVSMLDAPPHYRSDEASAWACGFNTALSRLAVPTARPLDMSGQPMGDPHPCELTKAGCDPVTGRPEKANACVCGQGDKPPTQHFSGCPVSPLYEPSENGQGGQS